MRRSLTLILVLALLGSLPLAASAAQPKLSTVDRAAITHIYTAVSALNPQLLVKAKKALSGVTGEYTRGCKPAYANETQAHKQAISNALVTMTYLRFVKLGYPLWASFARWVEGVKVSHPLLQQAKRALPIERSQGAKVAGIRFDVCGSVRELAVGKFSDAAFGSWATRLMASSGADEKTGKKADAMIHASRPVLLAFGLTSKQAKLMADSETGDIFSVMLGIT
ncbi:MAG: hypothetical protein ACXVZO_01070 [Gaiellaceae bacterium]